MMLRNHRNSNMRFYKNLRNISFIQKMVFYNPYHITQVQWRNTEMCVSWTKLGNKNGQNEADIANAQDIPNLMQGMQSVCPSFTKLIYWRIENWEKERQLSTGSFLWSFVSKANWSDPEWKTKTAKIKI